MPIEQPTGGIPNFFANLNINTLFLVKSFVMLLVIFYIVFSLILFRQIQLMDKAIPTPIGPFLKFVGIIQVGIALAFIFIVIGAF